MGLAKRLRWVAVHPLTSSALLLLIVFPLVRLSAPEWRESAGGPATLHRLLAVSDLLQSYRVQAKQPPPQRWQQRLGTEEASRLWTASDGSIWWTAWLNGGSAVLLLPATASNRSSEQSMPRLVFADPGQASVFEQQSRKGRPPRSRLMKQCLTRLIEGPAVLWSAEALPTMAGPISALLQSPSLGCLSLSLHGTRLSFRGVVASRPLDRAPAAAQWVAPESRWSERQPMTPVVHQSELVRLVSPRTDLLLGGLLDNASIKQSLETNFGLPLTTLKSLLDAPIQIRLESKDSGPFQAVLHLELQTTLKRHDLAAVLSRVGHALEGRGLERRIEDVINPDGRSASPAVVWSRAGGASLGGWILPPSKDSPQGVSLSVGGPPLPLDRTSSSAGRELTLSVRPADLIKRDLMSQSWSASIREAGALQLRLVPLLRSKSDWQWMEGQLADP